jgi:hypothetical protein
VNPEFNTALAMSAMTRQAKPPSRFYGVTSRVFPLRANMYRLRKFCDLYLNGAPEIARFQPFIPYVYLMVLDYGRMASEVANMGWVSQREVAFTVPLQWIDPKRGMRFVDYAAVSPFIYVDDETSLSTGRQVYGWPKVKVWADQQVNPWLYDPESSQHLLRLKTMVMPELYRGERQEPEVLLEVKQEVASSLTFPLDPSRPSSPFAAIPEAMAGYLGLVGSFFQMATGAPQMGFGGPPLDPLANLARMGSMGVASLGQNPALNNVTLKQFRDSRVPADICFQALVQSQIRVERFNAVGLLGEGNLAAGDPTGGFRLMVHRHASQPIIESLGIEVAQESTHDGGTIATLRPMFPFWVDVDLEYGLGYPICWRTRTSPWHEGNTDVVERIELRSRKKEPEEVDPAAPHPFNTTLSGALQGVSGPFDFQNVTVRVLPLLADPERLKEFVREYLYSPLKPSGEDSIGEFHRFEAWGSYVYLVATNYEEMSSATNNIGWWADRELNFLVPVKCFDEKGNLLSLGVVPAIPFVNTSTAAITGCEVRGQPTMRAVLEKPHDVWMDESGPSETTDQPFLRCRATVIPALSMGQKQELRTLVEVARSDALPENDDRWRLLGAHWGHAILEEHRRLVEMKKQAQKKKISRGGEPPVDADHYYVAKALALELLARGEPLNHFSLKQFRDSQDPDRACYQSVVRVPRWIDKIYDCREIEEKIHVRIHDYPSLPIVKMLGLIPKWSNVSGETKVDILQPLRPFWAKLSIHEGLGSNLCWRAGSSKWRADEDLAPEPQGRPRDRKRGFGYFSVAKDTEVGFGVLAGLGSAASEYESTKKVPKEMRRQHLDRTTQAWLDKDPDGLLRFTREEAAIVIQEIEPQLVLSAMQSADWQNWGEPRWFLRRHRDQLHVDIKSDLTFRTDSIGGPRERKRFFNPLDPPIPDDKKDDKSEATRLRWRTSDGEWYSEDGPKPWSS